MKKVLVTGANGYLGSHVVQYLLEQDYNVVGVDISDSNLPKGTKFVCKNILENNTDIYDELDRPDVVLHLAWRKGFIHSASEHMADLSLHFQFVRNMLLGGLKNLSIMGSMHEVGYYEGCIDANTPCNPMSQYGIAKHALQMSISEMVKREFSDCSFKWLRGFYIYGDDERSSSIFSKILKAASEGQKQFPFNSGKNKYDFLQIDELAEQVALASLQTEYNGIINCCSGIPVSLGEKVDKFIKEHKLNISLDYGKFPDRPYDSALIYGDNSIINKILNRS